jgi:ABC-2 type transport system ATP-binding protein
MSDAGAVTEALARPAAVAALAAETGPPALRVERLSHSYGARAALQDVSFTVPQSRFAALLGLNGAGKTTLFSLVTRLFNVRAGQIRVLGFDVDREPGEALRRLGVVFQARTLDLDLSVMENLLYHAALHGIGAREARRRAREVLADVELAERARDKARALSGGQVRRVEIARALLHRPQLLVLDEPTVGLDVASKAAIVGQVRRLVRERGVAVLWATHLLDEIEPGDEVVVLHHGRVVARGGASEIVAREGAADLRSAFTALTGGAAARETQPA